MCGLFLAFERGRPVDETRALRATGGLHHRGPDGAGHRSFTRTYAGTRGAVPVGCFAGHTRLSILDVSQSSSQPFRRRDRTLIHNGEIYNFRTLRDQLERRGIAFSTDGDTEALFELVAAGGADALHGANGMWAFCFIDEAAGIVTAARDRYGKKPLFYYASATTLCIASAIAPILAYLGREPEFVDAEIDTFLRHGWLFPHSDGATHIRGVRQVRAGAVLTFDAASWTIEESRYFDLAEFSTAGPRDADSLAEIVEDAILARLVADRKVGLLLSGGIDSSLILSILSANGRTSEVTCFTGDAGKSDDALYAKRCIEQLGIDHIDVPLDYGPGSIERFLAVCRHQEKPFPFIGNALAMPQLYARIADHDVPVVLDGTGGDEIFAGYWYRYYRFAIADAVAAGDQRWLAESLAANADDPAVCAIAEGAFAAYRMGSTRIPMQPGIVGATGDPADLDTFVRASVREARSSDPLEYFHGTLADALVTDAADGRLPEWLWQNDRNAMMSGIENRSPFLDYRLSPFMHSGYRNKFVGRWNKHELRSLFPAFVPLPTQWRRDKQGFRFVYSRFLRNHRSEVLEIIAASSVLRGRIDVDRLLDRARSRDDYLGCSLIERMLCVAGLEETMGLVATNAPAAKAA